MGAPKGNDNGKYLNLVKTDAHKKQAYEAYCKHVGEGHLKESFTWVSKDKVSRATYNTIKYLIEKGGVAFPSSLLEEAEAKNLFRWQKLAMGLSDGSIQGQGFVWINNMHNRFRKLGWNISQPKENLSEKHVQQEKADQVAKLAVDINESTDSTVQEKDR